MKNNPLKLLIQNLLESLELESYFEKLDEIWKEKWQVNLNEKAREHSNSINEPMDSRVTEIERYYAETGIRKNAISNIDNKFLNKITKIIQSKLKPHRAKLNYDFLKETSESVSKDNNLGKLIEKADEIQRIIEKADDEFPFASDLDSDFSEYDIPIAAMQDSSHEYDIKKMTDSSHRRQNPIKPNSIAKSDSKTMEDNRIQDKEMDIRIDGRKVGKMVIDYVRGQNLALPRGRGIFDSSVLGGL